MYRAEPTLASSGIAGLLYYYNDLSTILWAQFLAAVIGPSQQQSAQPQLAKSGDLTRNVPVTSLIKIFRHSTSTSQQAMLRAVLGAMTYRAGMIFRYGLLACIVSVFAMSGLAKRARPKPVAPVVYEGTKYSADGNGVDEYVVATDASSGKPLWTVRVAHNDHDPRMEQDVQDVYITDLKAIKGALLVRDEKSRCYSIDITTKRVNKQLWCHGF